MVWGDKHCLACLAPPWQGRRQPWAVGASRGLLGATWEPLQVSTLDRQSLLWGRQRDLGNFWVKPGSNAGRLDLTAAGWLPWPAWLDDCGFR